MVQITSLLSTKNGSVSVVKDGSEGLISIGLKTNAGLEYKFISEELYNLLVKELSEQKGEPSN